MLLTKPRACLQHSSQAWAHRHVFSKCSHCSLVVWPLTQHDRTGPGRRRQPVFNDASGENQLGQSFQGANVGLQILFSLMKPIRKFIDSQLDAEPLQVRWLQVFVRWQPPAADSCWMRIRKCICCSRQQRAICFQKWHWSLQLHHCFVERRRFCYRFCHSHVFGSPLCKLYPNLVMLPSCSEQILCRFKWRGPYCTDLPTLAHIWQHSISWNISLHCQTIYFLQLLSIQSLDVYFWWMQQLVKVT